MEPHRTDNERRPSTLPDKYSGSGRENVSPSSAVSSPISSDAFGAAALSRLLSGYQKPLPPPPAPHSTRVFNAASDIPLTEADTRHVIVERQQTTSGRNDSAMSDTYKGSLYDNPVEFQKKDGDTHLELVRRYVYDPMTRSYRIQYAHEVRIQESTTSDAFSATDKSPTYFASTTLALDQPLLRSVHLEKTPHVEGPTTFSTAYAESSTPEAAGRQRVVGGTTEGRDSINISVESHTQQPLTSRPRVIAVKSQMTQYDLPPQEAVAMEEKALTPHPKPRLRSSPGRPGSVHGEILSESSTVYSPPPPALTNIHFSSPPPTNDLPRSFERNAASRQSYHSIPKDARQVNRRPDTDYDEDWGSDIESQIGDTNKYRTVPAPVYQPYYTQTALGRQAPPPQPVPSLPSHRMPLIPQDTVKVSEQPTYPVHTSVNEKKSTPSRGTLINCCFYLLAPLIIITVFVAILVTLLVLA
jgi:hypothetical protein